MFLVRFSNLLLKKPSLIIRTSILGRNILNQGNNFTLEFSRDFFCYKSRYQDYHQKLQTVIQEAQLS